MPFYICHLCDYSTKQKNDYNRHLKTKKHRNKTEFIQNTKEKHGDMTLNDHIVTPNDHFSTPNPRKFHPKSEINCFLNFFVKNAKNHQK